MTGFQHEPVLLREVLRYLKPERGGVFVDCTVGGGGHAAAILEAGGSRVRLIGFDRDREALQAAKDRLSRFGSQAQVRSGNFRYLSDNLQEAGVDRVDGVLFDLGVSSHQLDEKDRGFSYSKDAPLDMRMGEDAPLTAAELLKQADAPTLTTILKDYGEERWAARIARFIVEAREKRPIETTGDLVDVVLAAIPAAARRTGPHPARRTFQALRIAVNDELEAIRQGLAQAVDWLQDGGIVVVISFHSLEDRIVKQHFSSEASRCICPPEMPVCRCDKQARLKILTRRPVVAEKDEVDHNPRARSAKLRAAERVLSEKERE